MPKTKADKRFNRKKLTLIISGSILSLLLFTVVLIWILASIANNQYSAVFSSVNNATNESLAEWSEDSANSKKYFDAEAKVSPEGAIDDETLIEMDRLSLQAVTAADEDCKNYDSKFVNSKEVPSGLLTTFLPKEKKAALETLRSHLTRQEKDYCKLVKASAGSMRMRYKFIDANNNWHKVYTSDYSDTAAIQALRPYSDGSISVDYRSEIVAAYGEKVDEQISSYLELYKKVYRYAQETDEAFLDRKWDELINAENKYYDSPLYSGLEEFLKQDANKTFNETFDFFQLLDEASSKESSIENYSAAATNSIVLHAALNKYFAHHRSYPQATDTPGLVSALRDKQYLPKEYKESLEGIQYKSEKSQEATMTVELDKNSDKIYTIHL